MDAARTTCKTNKTKNNWREEKNSWYKRENQEQIEIFYFSEANRCLFLQFTKAVLASGVLEGKSFILQSHLIYFKKHFIKSLI